jgi:opine dehydrogenase
MSKEIIAVLGGGSGAHAMAADLTVKGFAVNICEAPEFQDSFATTLKRQAITWTDTWGEEKTATLNKATMDFEEAIRNVKYIMMVLPGFGHRRFFDGIMPHLENGQTIVLWPGNYSGLLFPYMLKENGIDKDITFVEGHTLPWAARLAGPAHIQTFADLTKLLVGTLPVRNTSRVISFLKDIYPVIPGENILAPSLNNLNPIIHPAGSVLNAGWVDTLQKDYYFYKYGTTLSIGRIIKTIYQEVTKIGAMVSVKMLEYPEEAFRSKSTPMAYFAKAPTIMDEVVARVNGPSSIKHRYVSEDVPCGMVPMSQLARKFDSTVPIIESVIDLASVINQTDYRQEGRSLEELGIANLNKSELDKVLQDGF